MKRISLIIVALLVGLQLHAQKRVASITVQHIEIEQSGGYSSNKTPSHESIQLLSLVSRNYRGWYSYWTFPNSSYRTNEMSNGTGMGMYSSSVLDINTHLKGQELTIELKNKSLYWMSIDMSSVFYSIFYYDSSHDYWAPYSGNDHQYSLGTLFNYDRGAYDVVLLPPGASATCSYFRIDGYSHGYDIISSPIKDQSRLDFSLTLKVYLNDPFTQVKDRMRRPDSSRYSQQSPTENFIPYKGAYYMDGESTHLFSGNEDYLLPEYFSLNLKFICNVKVGYKSVKSHINDNGLEVYGW